MILASKFQKFAARCVLAVLLMATAVIGPRGAAAHEGHEHEDGHEHSAAATAESMPTLPQALVLPNIEGPKPWSDKPHLNDPNRFQIAIVTDRTGGHRPGIWMKAVDRLNLLRPEFVVSVGDLIEGYTTDRDEIETQWNEFLGFIDKMEMKFFFVSGNHDVTNPVMHEIWREHFGRAWYSFDYKGVHFVCLCSEDPTSKIGEEQLAWVTEDLEKNKDARWTLLFLHKPLWTEAERELAAGNEDPTNWKRIEALLGSRPHTVFAGHVHHYVQYDRNGMKYYHLATTGGGSQLRGVPYGEFDHVTWLTMEPEGPHVTHLLLDGILAPETVTEEGIARFRRFLARSSIEVAPILVRDAESFSEGQIHMRVANQFDQPIEIEGDIRGLPLRGLTVDPERLRLTAAPGETAELAVTVKFADRISFEHLSQTVLTAKIKTTGEDAPLSAERTLPVVIDQGYDLPRIEQVALDGDLGEWTALPRRSLDEPLVLGNSAGWTGPADAAIRFQVAHDDRFLYFAGEVSDERVMAEGDRIDLRLDARSMDDRQSDSRLGQGTYRFAVAAPGEEESTAVQFRGSRRERRPQGLQAVAKKTPAGYAVELAIPLELITEQQGDEWDSVQFTCVVNDVDGAGEDAAQVVWRGSDEVERRNTNFGHFVRTR
ncbi:MAG: metallophosphoesterase [Pirellulales bacterium]